MRKLEEKKERKKAPNIQRTKTIEYLTSFYCVQKHQLTEPPEINKPVFDHDSSNHVDYERNT